MPGLDESGEVIYRRMKASSEALRWERNVYRAALDEIAAGTLRPAHLVAQQAIGADTARREANVAAMRAGLPLPELVHPEGMEP